MTAFSNPGVQFLLCWTIKDVPKIVFLELELSTIVK